MIILLRTLLLLSYLCIAGVCASISFLYFSSMDAWVIYHKVEPTKSEFLVGEQLLFISNRTVFRESDLVFNDILFCRAYKGVNDFDSVSYYQSNKRVRVSNGPEKITWPYVMPVRRPTDCYLESYITLKLPFGISKHQTIVGPIFKIVENH